MDWIQKIKAHLTHNDGSKFIRKKGEKVDQISAEHVRVASTELI
jgi:hypothetical protein